MQTVDDVVFDNMRPETLRLLDAAGDMRLFERADGSRVLQYRVSLNRWRDVPIVKEETAGAEDARRGVS
jgi:hypothetical protein